MWIDDCEQKMETDLSKPVELTVVRHIYRNQFGCWMEGTIVESSCYKKAEFGNSAKFTSTGRREY